MGKGAGQAKGAGFAKLGISKPMMAPPAVLAPNSMYDSKTALFATRSFRRAG